MINRFNILVSLVFMLTITVSAQAQSANSKPSTKPSESEKVQSSETDENLICITSKNFKIYSTKNKLAAMASETAQTELKRITEKIYKFAKPPVYNIKIFLWNNEKEYREAAKDAPKKSRACTWKYTDKNGISQYRIDIKLPADETKFEDKILASVLPHEITHVLINTFFDKSLTSAQANINCPLALLEGFSIITENISHDQKIILNGLILQKASNDFSLANLLGTKRYNEKKDADIFYAQAYSFTNFLKTKLTEKQFKTLLKNMQEGADFETSIKRALYITDQDDFMQQLELAWKKYAIDQYNIAKSLQQKEEKSEDDSKQAKKEKTTVSKS